MKKEDHHTNYQLPIGYLLVREMFHRARVLLATRPDPVFFPRAATEDVPIAGHLVIHGLQVK